MLSIYKHFKYAAGTLPAVFLLAIASNAWAEFPGAPPFDLPDRGQIRLQLGEDLEIEAGLPIDHDPRRFVYLRPLEPAANVGDYPTGVEQLIGAQSKCLLTLSGAELVALSTTGGNGSGRVGVGPDSLGTPDGPKGVACYRVSANKNETIDFALGTDTTAAPDTEDPLPAGAIDANAFYALALDIEVKKNANVLLEIMINGSVTETFELRSGGSHDPDDEYPDQGGPIWDCSAKSDSGPDSGLLDNCHWEVNAIGNGFRLRNADGSSGEFSWEGGGDYFTAGTAFAHNSVIYLTKAEDIGALGCDPDNNSTAEIGGGSSAACSIVRQDTYLTGATCDPDADTDLVSYVFRSETSGCEFITHGADQTVMNLEITFNKETVPATSTGDAWELVPTKVSFGCEICDPQVEFNVERCDAPVVVEGDDGPLPIEAVRVAGADDAKYDFVHGNLTIEYACSYSRTIDWVGSNEAVLSEGIQFWGDIRWNR